MCIPNQFKLSVLAFALGIGAAAPGCMKPNPLVYMLGDGDGDDDGESESESSGDGDGDTESSGDGDGDGDTESSGDGDGDGDETSTPELLDMPSEETTDGNECAPLDAFAPECGTCLGTTCCELALACEAIEDCACLASCLHAGGNNGLCKTACNGTKADMPELDPVLACMDDACEAEC
jgi:hypothetical protein